MELIELLDLDRVKNNIEASSKKSLLQDLSYLLAKSSDIPDAEIFALVMERERLGSTGVGHGVAIPHARIPGLDKIVGCFASLTNPVDFDSIDDEPVDLVFMMVGPEDGGSEHLKALARISRLLRNRDTCQKLRSATNNEMLYDLLVGQRSVAA